MPQPPSLHSFSYPGASFLSVMLILDFRCRLVNVSWQILKWFSIVPTMSRSHKLNGGCLCGGLRYEIEEPPFGIVDCHCVDCRRSSGAPYVTWGIVQRERFKLACGT